MSLFWTLHKKKIIISSILLGIILLGLCIGLPIHFVNKQKAYWENSYLDRDKTRVFCNGNKIMALNIEYTTNNDEQKQTLLLTCEKINEENSSEDSIAYSIINGYFILPFEKKMNLKGARAYAWHDTNKYFKEWNGSYDLKNNIPGIEFDGYFIK